MNPKDPPPRGRVGNNELASMVDIATKERRLLSMSDHPNVPSRIKQYELYQKKQQGLAGAPIVSKSAAMRSRARSADMSPTLTASHGRKEKLPEASFSKANPQRRPMQRNRQRNPHATGQVSQGSPTKVGGPRLPQVIPSGRQAVSSHKSHKDHSFSTRNTKPVPAKSKPRKDPTKKDARKSNKGNLRGIIRRLFNFFRRKRSKEEPPIVRSVQRRGSTGKMKALCPPKKNTRRVTFKDQVRSKSFRHSHGDDKEHKSKKKGHKKKKKKGEKKSRPTVIRRNSTGGTQMESEPSVALYWNPAKGRLVEPVSYFETPAPPEKEMPDMFERGVLQRRASTGRVRMDDEDTTWMFAREDHEISNANVRGKKKNKSKKKKKRSKMKAAKKALLSRTVEKDSSSEQSLKHKQPEPQRQPLTVQKSTESDSSEDEGNEKSPRRGVERRGSTGTVPMEDEDSRLHRKKKMRLNHKRRQKAKSSSRKSHDKLSDAKKAQRPSKASLIGLLDPSMALDDGNEDPNSWLMGDEDRLFTIAPYRPPSRKIVRTRKLTPRELELELDGDSSDDESESSDSCDKIFRNLVKGSYVGKKISRKPLDTDDGTQATETEESDHEVMSKSASSRSLSICPKRKQHCFRLETGSEYAMSLSSSCHSRLPSAATASKKSGELNKQKHPAPKWEFQIVRPGYKASQISRVEPKTPVKPPGNRPGSSSQPTITTRPLSRMGGGVSVSSSSSISTFDSDGDCSFADF